MVLAEKILSLVLADVPSTFGQHYARSVQNLMRMALNPSTMLRCSEGEFLHINA